MIAGTIAEGYRGSLDPFEDMAAELARLGVAFTLTVRLRPDAPDVKIWQNIQEMDADTIGRIDGAHRTMIASIQGGPGSNPK